MPTQRPPTAATILFSGFIYDERISLPRDAVGKGTRQDGVLPASWWNAARRALRAKGLFESGRRIRGRARRKSPRGWSAHGPPAEAPAARLPHSKAAETGRTVTGPNAGP